MSQCTFTIHLKSANTQQYISAFCMSYSSSSPSVLLISSVQFVLESSWGMVLTVTTWHLVWVWYCTTGFKGALVGSWCSEFPFSGSVLDASPCVLCSSPSISAHATILCIHQESLSSKMNELLPVRMRSYFCKASFTFCLFCKKKQQKKCRDQDSNLGYCGHNAMS